MKQLIEVQNLERILTVGLPMTLLSAEVKTSKKRRPGMVIDSIYVVLIERYSGEVEVKLDESSRLSSHGFCLPS